jgi:hypothetical protein
MFTKKNRTFVFGFPPQKYRKMETKQEKDLKERILNDDYPVRIRTTGVDMTTRFDK